MSYCRFSCDNWRSDVYVYEDVGGGWTTHVADNRIVGSIPEEPTFALLQSDGAEWARRHKAVMDFLDGADRQKIGLGYDGATFNDPTPEACRARLLNLRFAGYHVPQHAIDRLGEEIEAKP